MSRQDFFDSLAISVIIEFSFIAIDFSSLCCDILYLDNLISHSIHVMTEFSFVTT